MIFQNFGLPLYLENVVFLLLFLCFLTQSEVVVNFSKFPPIIRSLFIYFRSLAYRITMKINTASEKYDLMFFL